MSSTFSPRRRQVLLGLGSLPLIPLLPRVAWASGAAIDPRVELLAMVFRLAGNPEYGDCRLPGYAESADTWFLPVRDHNVVKRARTLRREHGVSYDAVISMAAHLGPDFALRVTDPELPDLDQRWPRDHVNAFVFELQDFAKTSKAAGFLASKEATHGRIEAGIKALHGRLDSGWHARWFGVEPKGRYTVIASPLAGPSNYGSTLTVGGVEEIVSVLGVWEFGHDGLPTFGDASFRTLVHETSHAFANPVVYANEAAFAGPMARIFPYVQKRMAQMAYASWQTVLAESLVRASVVRYLAEHDDVEVYDEIEAQEKRGFLWMEPLCVLLERYEYDRETYPDLTAFVPELVAFFDRWGKAFEKRKKKEAANRPRVVKTTPPEGATISAATAAISIVFDRPMKDRSWSVVGSPADLPKLGTLKYDEEFTTLTIPVTLQAGKTYTLRLNSERFTGFQAADGTPLAPYVWTFTAR